MTKGINRLARRSFHRASALPIPAALRRAVLSCVCRFAQPPLLRRADTSFIFVRSSGEPDGEFPLPRPPPVRFSRFFSRRSCVVFSDFPSPTDRDVSLRCFSCPAFFFIAPLLTAPRKQPVVAANRSRLRVTNVSGPIDVGPPLFRDRSPPPAITKFDGKQGLHR